MGSFLLGQSPSVTQEPTTSTIGSGQTDLLSTLTQLLGGQITGNASAIGSNGASPQLQTAPLTSQQQGTINAQAGTTGAAANAVNSGLTNAISTDNTVAGSTPADFSSYFQNSVVAPLMQSFNQQTIPALQNAFGQSAGGTHSTEYGNAVDTAVGNLNTTIAGDASSTALTQYNDQQQNDLTAAGQDITAANSGISGLTAGLAGETTAQTTQQTAYSNAYQEFLNQLTQNNTELTTASGTATTGTQQQGNTVVNPGSAGLINNLVSAVGGAVGSKI
jgi:hypothetical protein